ncbi:MAG TPA: hypothetical protein VJT10_22905 [Steroidobacteraceae bacterium]|nr:hypothetical protein [Steroidobacteraceae bacterium]
MRYRYIYVCGLLAAAGAVQAGDYRPPRLPDGQVDLQGVWSHKNITPLERPAELESFIISREEAAQLQAKLLAKSEDLSRPAEPSVYFWERGVEAIRGEYRSSLITDPADGKIPATAHFTTLAKATGAAVLTAFDGPEARPGSERCLAAISAAPPVTVVPASDLRQIVQTPNSIVIASEELHEARVIRMNSRHVPAAVVSWLGDSIGWWEGQTLVIETKYFSETSAARGGPGSLFFVGPDTTVTERITRVSADELSYVFTVEDPNYYTQPWKGETRFGRSDEQILEYACHEGNYSLTYALMGGRATDHVTVAKQP